MWSLSSNGLGKKILRDNNYEYQDFITNTGSHAEGHSHFLAAISILQTPLLMPLLKRGVLVATFSKLQPRIYSLTWDFYPVTKYKRYFVRYIVGTKLLEFLGPFSLGKNQNI